MPRETRSHCLGSRDTQGSQSDPEEEEDLNTQDISISSIDSYGTDSELEDESELLTPEQCDTLQEYKRVNFRKLRKRFLIDLHNSRRYGHDQLRESNRDYYLEPAFNAYCEYCYHYLYDLDLHPKKTLAEIPQPNPNPNPNPNKRLKT